MRRPPKLRTRRSYAIEIVCYALLWVMNLWEIARQFRAMDLLPGLTTGMIFLVAPVTVWQAYSGWRESRHE